MHRSLIKQPHNVEKKKKDKKTTEPNSLSAQKFRIYSAKSDFTDVEVRVTKLPVLQRVLLAKAGTNERLQFAPSYCCCCCWRCSNERHWWCERVRKGTCHVKGRSTCGREEGAGRGHGWTEPPSAYRYRNVVVLKQVPVCFISALRKKLDRLYLNENKKLKTKMSETLNWCSEEL